MGPELAEQIAAAGWVRQRQIAESVVGLVIRNPAPDSEEALTALAAHDFGDPGVAQRLAKAIEELGDQPRAEQLAVLSYALHEDAETAARRTVEAASELIGPLRVEQLVSRMFAFPPKLLKHTPPSAWHTANREPTEQEIMVAFQNNGKFWYDTAGRGPYGGDPTEAMEIYALNQ